MKLGSNTLSLQSGTAVLVDYAYDPIESDFKISKSILGVFTAATDFTLLTK